MSYLTIKHIKGHPYLYEVHSEREGDRVRQVFDAYLGRADNYGAIKRQPRVSRAERRAKKTRRVPYIPVVSEIEATEPEITLDAQLRTFEAKQKAIIPTEAEYVKGKMAEYKETTLGLGFALDTKKQRETLKREYKVKYPAVTEAEAVASGIIKEKPVTPEVVTPVEPEVTPTTKQAAASAKRLAREREAQVFKETETKFAEESASTETIAEREARRKATPITPEPIEVTPTPEVTEVKPSPKVAEDFVKKYGLNVQVTKGESGGEYSGGTVFIGDDIQEGKYSAADWTGNKPDFTSEKLYPSNLRSASHEIVHGLFSKNPEDSHTAMESLVKLGVPQEHAFESLVDMGGLYLLEPDAITNPEIKGVLDNWIGGQQLAEPKKIETVKPTVEAKILPKAEVVTPITPEVTEKTWYRGIVSKELGGDTFWSDSESVAGDYGTAKIGEQATVRKLMPTELPKNPYVVEGSKQELADTLGIKLDPYTQGHEFDAEAKRILQSQGYDAIYYPEGTLGAEELHVFSKPVALPEAPVTPEVTKEPWQMTKVEYSKSVKAGRRVDVPTLSDLAIFVKEKKGASGITKEAGYFPAFDTEMPESPNYIYRDANGDIRGILSINVVEGQEPQVSIAVHPGKTTVGKDLIEAAIADGWDIPTLLGKQDLTKSGARFAHRLQVEKALQEGKPVPPEVLKDYPELAKQVEVSPAERIPEKATVEPTPIKKETEKSEIVKTPIEPTKKEENLANKFETDFIERSGQPEFYKPETKVKAKTFTQLITTQYDAGVKGNVRNVHIGKVEGKDAWADGFMLEIKPVPEKLKATKGYRELGETTEGKPRDFTSLVPDYSTEGVEVAPILKTPLEAIKGNATFLASKDKNQAIAMDSKYVDYFMANYPDAKFITKKLSISSPIVVQSRGTTVGVIMPVFKEASEYDTFLRYLRNK